MGRRDSTWEGYAAKFAAFVHFCTVVQAEAGAPQLSPLPAAVHTVLLYLGWLQEQDSVHHGSLQPYLSAINQAHADAGFEKPAVGHLVSLARKGFGELEADTLGAQERRVGLPAHLAFDIMKLGITTSSPATLRAAAAVTLAYLFFARADTAALAVDGRLRVDAHGLHFSEDAKNLPRLAPTTLTVPWPASAEATLHSPHHLIWRYLQMRECAWAASSTAPPPGASIWQLPGEPKHPASAVGIWLGDLLTELDVSPPPGVKYTGHSLRGGAASAALAIGVSLPAICRWGIWNALTSVMLYLDPLVPACDAAKLFFGHLLR